MNRTHCEECVSSMIKVPEQGEVRCGCEIGKYPDKDECLECDPRCTRCRSATLCSACLAPRLLSNSWECRCPVGFFEEASLECAPCVPGCLECENRRTCRVCRDRFFLDQLGTCQCRDNMLLNRKKNVCTLGFQMTGFQSELDPFYGLEVVV